MWRLQFGHEEEGKDESSVRSRESIWPLDGLLGHWEVHKWWPISQPFLFFLFIKCKTADSSFAAMFTASLCLALGA